MSNKDGLLSDEDLRNKLREDIGLFKYTFKYHDYIEAPEGTLGGKYPSPRAIAELDGFIDRLTLLIEQYALTKQIQEHILMQHQASVNLKTSKAAAGWSELRVKQLYSQLTSYKSKE